MNSLKALSNDNFNSLEIWPFGSPISTGARPILFSTENDQLFATFLVLFSSIEDIHNLASGHIDGLWPNFSFHHFIDDSDVGKCSPRHDEIVSPPGTISVEVFFLDPP